MRRVLVGVVLVGVLMGGSLFALADDFKIGINNFGQANFFARIGRTVLINTVEALGGTAISTVTDTMEARIAAIENFIAQGVDAIIIQEGDIKMAAPALEEAKRQGIIIASMDSGTAPFVDLVVESNNWVMGAMAATELLNRKKGVAKIVLITNPLGQMIRMSLQIRSRLIELVVKLQVQMMCLQVRDQEHGRNCPREFPEGVIDVLGLQRHAFAKTLIMDLRSSPDLG